MADEINEQVTEEVIDPAGEVESPDIKAAEVTEPEVPATSDQEDQEIADLQAAIEAAGTPEEKQAQRGKLNTAFAKLRRERREARDAELRAIKDAEYHRGVAEARKVTPTRDISAIPPGPDPMAPFNVPRPTEDGFETYAEYEAAKDDWLVSRAKHEAKTEALREFALTRATADMGTWMQQAPSNLPDFEVVVRRPVEDGGPPLSMEMVEICRSSPVGHQLLYQLAENPKEVIRLRGMPAHLMAVEIARREAKLTAAPASPKKISDAPTPIQPITPAATNITKPLEELTEAEYIARRNREEFGPNWRG